MKRPIFLTVWLLVMLLLSIAIALDSLTYLHFIFLTKNYLSLFGIVAGFVQIGALVQLLRWKKIGIPILLSSMVVVFIITAVNEFSIVSNLNQILVSMLLVLVVNSVMLGILYLAIRSVWKHFL